MGTSIDYTDHSDWGGSADGNWRVFLCARAGHLLDDHALAGLATFQLWDHYGRLERSGYHRKRWHTCAPGGRAAPPPVSIPESDLPPAWDGASRINILLIGLDYRDWLANEGAPRSDTMIVFTIDPLAKTAGMLSIPRDMWVNIPGFGYSRINTAYSSGEGSKLPGGGPELARRTAEQFLGVPIQYYAQVDFFTFVEFIDLIGGVEIYNDEDLRLDPVGGGKDKIRLTCCGIRELNGERALAYARFRKD